jgi:iron transport multicopper oxidase
MAFFKFSSTSFFLLIHIALFSSFSLAADPTVYYDFKLSYITVSPLGVPQKVPFLFSL